MRTGGVRCWGGMAGGGLVYGTTKKRSTPVDVYGLTSVESRVTAGGVNECALTESGLACWGNDLGTSEPLDARLTPGDVLGLSGGVEAIAARYRHTCALSTGSGVMCWGENGLGQLGDGSAVSRRVPVDVVGLE